MADTNVPPPKPLKVPRYCPTIDGKPRPDLGVFSQARRARSAAQDAALLVKRPVSHGWVRVWIGFKR